MTKTLESASLRADYIQIMRARGEKRPPERLVAHYVLERDLARRIREAPSLDRARIYTEVYDQLFNALPDHPQHEKKNRPGARPVQHSLRYLSPFFSKEATYLEIGCGDAAVSVAAAASVRQAIAVDVQDKLLDDGPHPPNFRFVKLQNGTQLPFDSSTIDVCSSDQLIEHLHPDDVLVHLQEVVRILKPGGLYICTTPSALTGPHDISTYFGFVANGLHIKEYNYRDLSVLFVTAGFKRLRLAIRAFGRQVLLPISLGILAEKCFSSFPLAIRTYLARTRAAQRLFGVNVVGVK